MCIHFNTLYQINTFPRPGLPIRRIFEWIRIPLKNPPKQKRIILRILKIFADFGIADSNNIFNGLLSTTKIADSGP